MAFFVNFVAMGTKKKQAIRIFRLISNSSSGMEYFSLGKEHESYKSKDSFLFEKPQSLRIQPMK